VQGGERGVAQKIADLSRQPTTIAGFADFASFLERTKGLLRCVHRPANIYVNSVYGHLANLRGDVPTDQHENF